MPRYRRVSWQITAGSTAKATTIQSAINTALSGKATQRVKTTSAKSGVLVSGDYLFTLAADADSVYTAVLGQLNGTNAVSGVADKHDCDHDGSERAMMGGCVAVARTER